MRQRALD